MLTLLCFSGWVGRYMMIKHFIFDWSGTLADDLPPVLDATNRLFANHGKPTMTRDQFTAQFRLPFKEFYDEVLPEVLLDDLEPEFSDYFAASAEAVTLLPFAKEFLAFCRRRGGKMFILSSAKEEFFRQQARDLGVLDAFDAVYAGVKDKREMIWKILETHGLNADETAFLGDMVHDVETAHHAGVHAIALLTGYDAIGKLSAAKPDLIATNLGQLMRVMGGSTKGDALLRLSLGVVKIEGLELPCQIGVPDGEREDLQTLVADIDLHPIAPVGMGEDAIGATVDYHAACEAARAEAARMPRQLVETLAADLIRCLLDGFALRRVDVRIRKTILPYTESVGVELSGEVA